MQLDMSVNSHPVGIDTVKLCIMSHYRGTAGWSGAEGGRWATLLCDCSISQLAVKCSCSFIVWSYSLYCVEVVLMCICEVRMRGRCQWMAAVQTRAVRCWTAVVSEQSGCWCWHCCLRWPVPSSLTASRYQRLMFWSIFSCLITFCVRRSGSKMYSGHSHLCVCLSVPCHIPTLLHGPGCKLGEW